MTPEQANVPRPRILVLAPDTPYPGRAGGQMRMASLLPALAATGTVHVACLKEEIPPETQAWCAANRLTIACYNRRGLSRFGAWFERLRTFVAGSNLLCRADETAFFRAECERFDPTLVWLETPYLMRYAWAWRKALPLVCDYWGTSEGALRDLRNARGLRRPWEWLRWRAANAGERSYAPGLAGMVTVSAADAAWFRSLAPGVPVFAVPIGIRECGARDGDRSGVAAPGRRAPTATPALLFTGDLSYRPNIDAVQWFVREILPAVRRDVPNVVFRVAGRAPVPELQALRVPGQVEILGFVPDLGVEIAAAAVYVLPMRLGSGIRSKLFDVFPRGTAIVTTSTGAEGLELKSGENCLVADAPAEFAAACVQLLRSPQEAARLGAGALRLATEVYSQAAIARQVAAVIAALAH